MGSSARERFTDGTVLAGRYRVAALLGRGGTGDVYRVVDGRTGEPLALKWLLRGNAAELAAFEREFHTLRDLSHPNVVRAHDYCLVEGRDGAPGAALYTMELLEGEDLGDCGALPYRRACSLLRDVASALAILHSRRLLHRDVSARNVRCAPDGKAKLLDFGAMTPMGPAERIVGTAPFVAPEVLQLQTLDARSDLYSLGALAYRLLTGRAAYPAQSFADLRELWSLAPVPVRTLSTDVPRALEELILELLHLDRSARPSCAAEVIERLSGIAGLAPIEPGATTRAYLSQPSLVGRKAELESIRSAVVRGNGGAFLIEGPPAAGRTRLLEAGLMEAQLAGWTVLRVNAASAGSQPHAALRSLHRQLELAHPGPGVARGAGRGALLDAPGTPTERSEAHAALRRFWLRQAATHRLVIAIDDLHAIDEPSRSLLATLASPEQTPSLCLMLTALDDEDAAPGSALEVLRERAVRMHADPLPREDTEELLRSVFGDAEQLTGVGRTIHTLSEGRPGWTMALAEHLVDQGVARYGAGSWSLPAQLEPSDLPGSLTAAFLQRIEGLDPDARELAGALATTRCVAIEVSDYVNLTAHGDRTRTFRALDALVAAGVLRASAGRFDFAHAGLAACAAERVENPAEVHSRIADIVRDCDDPLLWPEHLLACSREREALQRLLELQRLPQPPFSTRALRLLERAVPACAPSGIGSAQELGLRMWLVEIAAMRGHGEVYRRHAMPLLEQLERCSGIADLQRLDPALPIQTRFAQAFGAAQARHDDASDGETLLPPALALPLLGRLCAVSTGLAQITQDLAVLERLPTLAELAPLVPALGVVDDLVRASTHFQRGRFDRAGEVFLQILDRISEPDRAGLGPVEHTSIRHAALYTQGVLAAARGQRVAPTWLEELERVAGHRVNTWRVRMTSELMQGQIEAAVVCRRRAELLHLQDGGELPYPGSTGRIELLAHIHCGDPVGVKRAMERIAMTAARYDGWEATHRIAHSHYLHLRGEHAEALDVLESVLAKLEPGRHIDWGVAAASLPVFLGSLGRHDEAISRGREYLDVCLREDLSPTHRALLRTLAEALVQAGRHEEAIPLIERCIDESFAVGSSGMSLGLAYETRARAALGLRDREGFLGLADACAREFGRGKNEHLRGRFERLLRDARTAGIDVPMRLHLAVDAGEAPLDAAEALREQLREQLRSCSSGERARVGLMALIEHGCARAGALLTFGPEDRKILASSEPALLSDSALRELRRFATEQLGAGAVTTAVHSVSESSGASSSWSDEAGRVFSRASVMDRASGRLVVAVLHQPEALSIGTARVLLEALVAELGGDDQPGSRAALA